MTKINENNDTYMVDNEHIITNCFVMLKIAKDANVGIIPNIKHNEYTVRVCII